MGFGLAPTSLTLNDLERRNSPYFALVLEADYVADKLIGLIIIIIIIHEFHGDTSVEQNFRDAANITYYASVNATLIHSLMQNILFKIAYLGQNWPTQQSHGLFATADLLVCFCLYKSTFPSYTRVPVFI